MNEEELEVFPPNRNLIDVRIINAYRRYALEGDTQEFDCQVDNTHPPLVASVTLDGDVCLFCLAGDYSVTVGLARYQKYFDYVSALTQ